MKVAYFDAFAGASGDMVLGSLMDAGLPLESLRAELRKLPLSGYTLDARPAQRGILHGTKALIIFDDQAPTTHRRLADITDLIASGNLPERVKEKSVAIFQRLAQAEAKVHRISPEEVHFHEVGAVDAIVDIVGSVLGLHLLDVEEVYVSPLPLGSGVVRAAHGSLPVPAPATLGLLAMANAPAMPERPGSPLGETLTPTGAAILTTLATFGRPAMTIERIGHGAGARETGDLPNVLRLWLGEKLEAAPSAGLIILETNIDDMSPELLGFAFERLFAQGAKDVWLTPIQMKKNRAAVMLSVLAGAEQEASLVEIILRETTTLGVRVRPVERHESRRESFCFESSLGTVSVKVKRLPGSPPIFAPEYEDCRRLALEKDVPLQEVYRLVMAEAPEQWRARH